MASTTYPPLPTMYVTALQSRTDDAGVEVVDLKGADLRAFAAIFSGGVAGPDAYEITAGTGLQVLIGQPADLLNVAVVPGENQGQGNYVVGMPGQQAISVPPADPALLRQDSIWLVVQDDPYDASGLVVARYAYRVGDPGGGVPDADPAWTASIRLCNIKLAASSTEPDVTDTRTFTNVADHNHEGVYLKLTGGTMTGQVKLIAPVDDEDAASKGYVDALIAGVDPGTLYVRRDGSLSMQGNLNLGDNQLTLVADPTGDTHGMPRLYADGRYLLKAEAPATHAHDGDDIETGIIEAGRLPDATTSNQGVVMLIDNLTSTTVTKALTANKGKDLNDDVKTRYNYANAPAASPTITAQGTEPTNPSVGDIWLEV